MRRLVWPVSCVLVGLAACVGSEDTELPRWHVYVLPERRSPAPPAYDAGGLVAVRAGDEARPERYLVLSLERHWMLGDGYFAALMHSGRVSAVDLMMITSEVLAGRTPPLSTLMAALLGEAVRVHARSVEQPGDFNPFPGWGEPLSSGGGTAGGGTAGGSKAPPSGGGSPPPPKGGSRRPSLSGPPAINPAVEADAQKQRQQETIDLGGIWPASNDPLRQFPAGSYRPAPGERAGLFRCEGKVYRGYKRACLDFQDKPDVDKWKIKLAAWEAHSLPTVAMTPADKEKLCKWGFSAAIVAVCGLTTFGCVAGEVVTVGGVTVPCWVLATVMCGATSESVHNILDCHEWAYR